MVLRFCLHLSRLISLRRESQAKITLFIAVVKSTHITSESYFGYLTSKSDSEAIDKIQRVCFSPAFFFIGFFCSNTNAIAILTMNVRVLVNHFV